MLLTPNQDDFCPCGSTKKYRRCHADPRLSVPLQGNPNIDTILLALAYTVLDLLKDAIESVSVPDISATSVEEVFRKRTLLYFAKKVYRATLAGVTLLRAGQSTQAFTLKRDQYHAWVAFFHYFYNESSSVLFMASGPLRQRNHTVERMALDENVKNDPKSQAQLREHSKNAERLYKRFPGLKVPKGKSGDTNNPIMIDWSEPSEFEMMRSIVKTWPEELEKRGERISDENIDDWIERETRKAHFLHSGFPSFDMHGNPMGIIGDLNEDDEYGATDLRVDSHEPNGLLYIYLSYPAAIVEKLVELAGAAGFEDRIIKVSKAMRLYREYFDAGS